MNTYRFFDPAKFHEQALGQEDFKRELREVILNELPPMLETIKISFIQRNTEDLKKDLHRLKGSISLVSLPAVIDDLFMLENTTDLIDSKQYEEKLNEILSNVKIMGEEIASHPIP